MQTIHSLRRFARSGRASVIVGGQFGSEAKGLAAAIASTHMYIDDQMLICTTNAGAQAGHTTVLEDGSKFVCYHLPTIGVMRRNSMIYINAGAVIDPELLHREVEQVADATGENIDLLWSRITIHPQAAIITNEHKDIEAERTRHLGSTRKGIGAALCDKIMRIPDAVAGSKLFPALFPALIRPMNLSACMDNGYAVTVEIPQGTGLSINSNKGFYPYCTSRECWLGQGLTDAGIHPHYLHEVMMVMRTLPIRVGNIEEEGKARGYSGPFYPDCQELNWERDLPGITPEITTVTKRQRRIATFSAHQYEDALRLNRPTIVLNTFMNYLNSLDRELHLRKMMDIEMRLPGYLTPIHLLSTGPKVSDTMEDTSRVR